MKFLVAWINYDELHDFMKFLRRSHGLKVIVVQCKTSSSISLLLGYFIHHKFQHESYNTAKSQDLRDRSVWWLRNHMERFPRLCRHRACGPMISACPRHCWVIVAVCGVSYLFGWYANASLHHETDRALSRNLVVSGDRKFEPGRLLKIWMNKMHIICKL